MATQTFTPAVDYGSHLSKKPRVRAAQFGDGYQQRVGDGINTAPEEWAINFTGRTAAEANEILNFLEARAGVEAFWWVSPRGTVGLFICPEWTHAPSSYSSHSITAKFQQVFQPDSSTPPAGSNVLPNGTLMVSGYPIQVSGGYLTIG